MQIVCPTCTTSYEVEMSTLGTAGRSVRCVRCRSVWFASAPAQEPIAVTAEPVDPSADWAAWSEEAAPADVPESAAPTTGDSTDFSAIALEDSDAGGADALDALATADAPPLAPADGDTQHAPHGDPALGVAQEDIESVAARRFKQTSSRFRVPLSRPNLAAAIVALVAINAALIMWRTNIVRAMPQTGSLYGLIGLPVNLRGLAINDVKSMREAHDGVPVLVVEGEVANVAKTPLEVPRLRLAVRNDRGAEVYAWTVLPARSILSPGEHIPFRSRLASPPGEGREVLVRFFNRRDVAAGMH
jgi:predicted Zn finger-like uncharacterized protein